MCGIWGFVSRDESFLNRDILAVIKQLFYLSEIRGREAAGIAVLNDKAVHVFKRALPAHKMLKETAYKEFISGVLAEPREKGVALVGHSRLVTNGSQYAADNNQPVIKKKTVTVHNGIIVNTENLALKFPNMHIQSELDTEVFVELIEYFRQSQNTAEAFASVYREIYGMASTLSILAETGDLVAATNNGSLFACRSKDGKSYIFASEKIILQRAFEKNHALSSRFLTQDVTKVNAGSGQILQLSTMKIEDFDFIEPTIATVSEPEPDYTRDIIENKEISTLVNKPSTVVFNKKRFSKYEIDEEPIRHLRRCTCCVLPETMPFIEFDEQGVCNYCRTYKKQDYADPNQLKSWAEKVRRFDGQHDSIISFSGGRDSSYGMHYFVKELGLHPLAFSYDWGMVTDLARRNQSRMCDSLGVELIIVSADIQKKRLNVQKNIVSWLKKPDLGMIPLFMAGDKQYFYHANRVRKEYQVKDVLMASNPFEVTHFKSGFCGVRPAVLSRGEQGEIEHLSAGSILRMAGHYTGQYVTNPGYFNGSLLDTLGATISYYMIPHNYMRLFNYMPWQEDVVNSTLIGEYDWETSPETKSTWRIGDGTAPFYNYIYYLVAGFTENDTLRSNQIREGLITREDALTRVYEDNAPRFESLQWYFDAVKLDMDMVLGRIKRIPRKYEN